MKSCAVRIRQRQSSLGDEPQKMVHVPVALTPISCSVCQLILRPAMRRIISGSFSSSMKGPVFVSLIDVVPYISMTQSRPRKDGDAHGEHNDADRPAVDEVVVSMDSHTLHDDFRREVVGCPTHRLLGRDQKLYFAQTNNEQWNAP